MQRRELEYVSILMHMNLGRDFIRGNKNNEA